MPRLKKRYKYALVLLLVLISVWLVFNWVFPRILFRKAVLYHIPASVKSIKGCGLSGLNERHKYILRFNISESDIQLILNSDQFQEIGYVKYSNNGILHYGEDRFKESTTITYDNDGNIISTDHRASDIGSSFHLFLGWYEWFPPKWFELDKWNTFKAYVVEINRNDYYKVRLLLYNPDIGQAYFIEYELRGM
jgi:hypothetical protein